MEWMILPFKRYADFEGRSRRMEYWMFQLLNILVVTVLSIPVLVSAELSGGGTGDLFDDLGIFGVMSGGLLLLYIFVAFIPSLAVTFRRFHDRGLTAWIYVGLVVAGLIPLIGFIASIAAFVITVLPGDEGPNEYGPDPKNHYDEDMFA